MPDAVDTRCRMHRLATVLVERTCGGCGDPLKFKLSSCTVCSDFSTLLPAEFPRSCRG